MKLFEVEITKRVYIVAESPEAAEKAAGNSDVREDDSETEVYASEAKAVPADRTREIPYGAADGSAERDWTIAQWLESWK